MLRHRFLTSLLVWSAHAQLTPQPPFQRETGEATPSDSISPSHSILSLRSHSSHDEPSGTPTSSIPRVSAQPSEMQGSGRKRQLSPDGPLRNYGLAQSAAQLFGGIQVGSGQLSQVARNSRTVEEAGGTPWPMVERATPSRIAQELNQYRHLSKSVSVEGSSRSDEANSQKATDVLHDGKPTEDAETATISYLLRETLLNQNPSLSPGHFASHGVMSYQEFQDANWQLEEDGEEDSGVAAIEPDRQRSVQARGVPQQGGEEGDRAISVEQRSWRCSIPDVLVEENELPWTCRQRFAWRHLGEHVYPSRLYESVCEGRTCWYGHFNCTPITYTLHVLQVCLHGCHDQRVPFPLRSRWQWIDLNVTVGCQCVR